MSIVIIRQDNKIATWKKALQEAAPDIKIYSYLEDHDADEIEVALVWKHPENSLSKYKNLKYIASSGAGVDFIFEDVNRDKTLPITRVIDTMLAADMSEHVLALIFNQLKNLSRYKLDQVQGTWSPQPYKRIADLTVGVLGLGALGNDLVRQLVQFGFQTQGWSNSQKSIEGVATYSGTTELNKFLNTTNVLVCLLPLTPLTKGFLNKELFEKLPKGAFVINVARGGHLVDEDLVEMLDNAHLSGASLDVFHEEPLDPSHPFWQHKKIVMTPHCASVSDTNSVVPQIIENFRRMKNNEDLLHLVSTQKGY